MAFCSLKGMLTQSGSVCSLKGMLIVWFCLLSKGDTHSVCSLKGMLTQSDYVYSLKGMLTQSGSVTFLTLTLSSVGGIVGAALPIVKLKKHISEHNCDALHMLKHNRHH